MMEKLQQERLEVSIKCQANAEEAFKEALAYAKTREAFGRPIGDFQYTAFRLAEMATEVQMGRTFLGDLIAKHIRGESIVQEVSMAKYWLGEMVNRIAYQAVQIHGGYGYMEEYGICRIYRDVRALSIFAGTYAPSRGKAGWSLHQVQPLRTQGNSFWPTSCCLYFDCSRTTWIIPCFSSRQVVQRM